VNRILKLAVFFLAAMYFLVDAIFLSVARSLADRIAGHWLFDSIRVWIIALPRYPTLALFALPLVLLEPVKPMAAYLVGTGHVATGLITLVLGEILKLVLVERLFNISRDKLMSIPSFACAYWKYRAAKHYVTSMVAWQVARRWILTAQFVIRSFALKLGIAQRLRPLTFQ
jgi:hypothetical protein